MSSFSPPSRPGRPFPRGELLRLLLILALALGTANSLLSRIYRQGEVLVWWAGLAALLLITTAFLLHRHHPETALLTVALTLTACLFLTELRISVEVAPAVFYAAYLASAYSRRRWRRLWLGWLLAGTGTVVLTVPFTFNTLPTGPGQLATAGLITGLVWAVIGFFWLLGAQTRHRREDLAELQERAELAGVVERTRIAREMHDIIAHNLSGIIALADGARYASAKNPAAAVDALSTISVAGREALTQMRGLLSVLRTENPRTGQSAPGVPDLVALIEDARRAGLAVTVTGLAELPRDLPDLIQFTLYRIVQEMLTNMLKYSPTSAGTLSFTFGERKVTVTSQNPAGWEPDPGTGYGLVGMAERVRAHDGTFTRGSDGENFTVTAEVPR